MLQKTLFLSGSHFIVRVIGFAMRIWLSRSLGPQAMGLVELAGSAQMLLVTPVVSGLPAAVTRMCAKADGAEQARVLRCGAALALAVSLPLSALAFLLREPMTLWLGDIRAMPALLFALPCIPVLGLSAALNGYFYGTGRPMPPALSEIFEQIVRFALCLRLVSALRGWPLPLRAAIPAAAALVGETAGLLFALAFALRPLFREKGDGSRRSMLAEMLSLALPLTGMRLVSSLMRTVNAVLIPARLQLSGLGAQEALGRLGMMQGMLIPVLMLPSFVTGSLSMVCAPELTRRQSCGRPIRPLVRRVCAATLAVGLSAMAGVWLFAPPLALKLYRQAELLPLLRRCCPMIPLLSCCHVLGGMMNALGLQRASLRISLASNLVGVLLTYALCATPMRLYGALVAMAASHALTLALHLRALHACAGQN